MLSFPEYAICAGCNRPVWWPIWLYAGDDRYHPLCEPCRRRQAAEFNEANAIIHAIIICGLRQGILNAQEARDE